MLTVRWEITQQAGRYAQVVWYLPKLDWSPPVPAWKVKMINDTPASVEEWKAATFKPNVLQTLYKVAGLIGVVDPQIR